ncbi:MAG: hypothetical protein QOD96_5732, partial [Pseudonocardiales bacterium]|nr:hypothetical protein [Pseudonocardiales bacterium]
MALQLRPESTSESLSSLSPELLLGAAPSGTNLLTVPVPDQPHLGLSEENTACWPARRVPRPLRQVLGEQ